VYTGRVVNVTKFGAFVNVLPGKDGLLHISKLGRGKRIDRVEDVLNLGDEVEVKVDDIDNSGKLSLSLVGDDAEAPASGGGDRGEGGGDRPQGARDRDRDREPAAASASAGDGGSRATVSFEDTWEETAKTEFGDLGPAGAAPEADRGDRGGDGGRRRRGGRR
jgi:polyribonucleotide nucleotidyltransferase